MICNESGIGKYCMCCSTNLEDSNAFRDVSIWRILVILRSLTYTIKTDRTRLLSLRDSTINCKDIVEDIWNNLEGRVLDSDNRKLLRYIIINWYDTNSKYADNLLAEKLLSVFSILELDLGISVFYDIFNAMESLTGPREF